jgi:hypothetical protein
MARHDPGPRRSESVESYLRETRALAVVALLALVGGVVSDALAGHFWTRHELLASLVASLIVVMLSAALVNEALERRSRRRWSVLAQYVMLEFVLNARLVWTGILELAGLMPADATTTASIDAGARLVRDTPRLAAAVRDLIADGDRRRVLHDEVSSWVSDTDELLGRWAQVMLNADAYAEVLDRHVELASDLTWLSSLLDYAEPSDDDIGRRRKARGVAAVQIAGEIDDEQLADRLVVFAQLAEELDRSTVQIALRIVPLEWWAARRGGTAPVSPPALGLTSRRLGPP